MRVILAGGGTAGHINPALAIAGKIKETEPKSEFLFFGTKNGLEKELVKRNGYNIKFIDILGFKRKITPYNLKVLYKAVSSVSICKKEIKKFKPDIVIGTGGYVSGPVLKAATMLKIPTLIHEQNVFAGMTTKMLSKNVNTVCISFSESKIRIPNAKNVVLTGNPLRGELFDISREESRKISNCGDLPLILAFGGSLGAKKLNEAIVEFIKNTKDKNNYKMIFATGQREFENVKEMLKGISNKSVEVVPYIHNMHELMPGADLVIGRSGAITVSELGALKIASVLVPSPNVTDDHQTFNAKALSEIGGAVLIPEHEINKLPCEVEKLISDKEKLSKMAEMAGTTGIKNASELILNEVIKLTKGK